jgi:RecB family exonuclease
VSATALQTLGTCPHRYMLRYVLRVRPPDDPMPAPDEWLRPAERGSLLHAVFEETLREAAASGVACDDPAFTPLALDILQRHAAAWRARVQPPGVAVHDAEMAALRQDVLAFAAMVREDEPKSLALEHVFGLGGMPPVEVPLPDGSVLLLSGAIDRVDEQDDGTLVIIDYKTGSTQPFQGKKDPFAGGRRLQHALYAAAAERIFGRPVARAEFHFPTRRSENHRARFDARSMAGGLAVVADLLEMVRNGWFVPTNEAEDCKWCDYAAVCRAAAGPYGRVESPLAQWARNVDDEAMSVLRRLR